MAEKIVWCQKDVSENIGDPRKLCGAATKDGARECSAHEVRPIWPLNDDGSVCLPGVRA